MGVPDLYLTGWIGAQGRKAPLQLWGPEGTRAMMQHTSAPSEARSAVPTLIMMAQFDFRTYRRARRPALACSAFRVRGASPPYALSCFITSAATWQPRLAHRIDR
jgi:hypothetical protein